MPQITPKVVQFDDEPAWSVLHRAASRAGVYSARTFAEDWGLDYDEIVQGPGIAKFAKAGGYDRKVFERRSLLRRTGDYVLGNQVLNLRQVHDGDNRICPACIRGDRENGTGSVEARAHWRDWWFLADLEVCPIHSVEMHAVPEHGRVGRIDEKRLDPTISAIDGADLLARPVISVENVDAEAYVLGRLGFMPPITSQILDKMQLSYAITAMRSVGGFALSRIEGRDWRLESANARLNVGFRVLRSIADYMRHLDDLYARRDVRRGHHGPRVAYGELYGWLLEQRKAGGAMNAYALLSRNLYEHALKTFPLQPNTKFLDRRIETRNLYQISDIWRRTKIHTSRLPAMLDRAGITDADTWRKSSDDIFIPAEQVDRFCDMLRGSVNGKQVRSHYGVPRGIFTALIDAGVLVPWIQTGDAKRGEYVFLEKDLDDFFLDLRGVAEEVRKPPEGSATIEKLVKHVRASAAEIIRAVQAGDLRCAAYTRDVDWCSLHFDIEKAVRYFKAGRGSEVSAAAEAIKQEQAIRYLKSKNDIVRELVARKHLSFEVRRTVARPGNFYKVADLDRFAETYMSTSEAAEYLGSHPRGFLDRLRLKTGISPVIEITSVPASNFYLREEIVALEEGSLRSAVSQRQRQAQAKREAKTAAASLFDSDEIGREAEEA